MANSFYNAGFDDIIDGTRDLLTDDYRVILIDSADYTFAIGHTSLTSVPVAARVATSTALTSKTFATRAFDAANVTFSSVTGDASEALIIYYHTGTDSTSVPLLYLDGFSVTPGGGDITVTWGANIFSFNATA